MKFEFKNSLIYIPISVKYNGQIIDIPNCIVDTGSSDSANDSNFIALDFKKPTTLRKLVGIGGYEEVIEQNVDAIIVDGHEILNIKVQFGNLENKYKIDGFIGNSILRNFSCTIDYKNFGFNLTRSA